MQVVGDLPIRFVDYGITPPNIGGFVSVGGTGRWSSSCSSPRAETDTPATLAPHGAVSVSLLAARARSPAGRAQAPLRPAAARDLGADRTRPRDGRHQGERGLRRGEERAGPERGPDPPARADAARRGHRGVLRRRRRRAGNDRDPPVHRGRRAPGVPDRLDRGAQRRVRGALDLLAARPGAARQAGRREGQLRDAEGRHDRSHDQGIRPAD